LFADADRISFAGITEDISANINVIIAGGEIGAGMAAKGDVVAAAAIAIQRLEALRRIVVTSGVAL
jgi:hypothetical protein